MFKVKLLLHNITVRNTLTINHSLSNNQTHEPGGQLILGHTLLCGGRLSAAAWVACSRRSLLLFWAPRAGCWCPPHCPRTIGRCPPWMAPSSPQRHTGPTSGGPVSLTPLESPTVKSSPRCWRWTVSHLHLLTGILALCLQAFVSWPFKRILSILLNWFLCFLYLSCTSSACVYPSQFYNCSLSLHLFRTSIHLCNIYANLL